MTRRIASFPVVLGLLVAAAGAAAAVSAPAVVSTAWLAERLAASSPAVAVVDARGLPRYLAGHLPGAVPLGVENLRSASGGAVGALFPPETLAMIARRLGIGPETNAVVYADESDVDATYVASALRIAGAVNVSVLDSGFARWTAEKRAVTKERKPVPAAAAPLTPDPSARASIDDVREALRSGNVLLLDARPPEQYAAGHIAGAKNRFWKADVEAGAFRGEAETRAELERAGASKDAPVIVYCNSGHMASELFYTLKYHLRHEDVRLYDGSWLEWSISPNAPTETGAAATERKTE